MRRARLDMFPKTQRTWIDERLASGETGLGEVRSHIMELYSAPLCAYVQRSSYRGLGDPLEIVHGFFADRLARADFLAHWSEAGMPLRRWLVNGLCFFLRESLRREVRDKVVTLTADGPTGGDAAPLAAMEQAFAVSLVQRALALAERACMSDGLSPHWRSFVAHQYEGTPYSDVGRELGVTKERAAVMARAGVRRFRDAICELLLRDGVAPDRINETLAELSESTTAAS